MPVRRKAHHAQLAAMPPSRTRLVTRFGVSVLNVVATIDTPISHQGAARPEVKNSVVLLPARRAIHRAGMNDATIDTRTIAKSKVVRRTRLHVDDFERRRRLPAAAREIREVHRGRPALDRLDAQVDDRAQRRGVVHVHVRRLALAQALDQAIVLDEVHAAMAGALRLLGDLLPERMLELRQDGVRVLPLILLAAALDVDAARIALKEALRALDHVDAAVGTRQIRAVLDQ